jgi:PAS domain S-box-containing protein
VLDRIAAYLDRPADRNGRGRGSLLADQHAVERLREGFDITEVVEELAMLRDAVLRRWRPSEIGAPELEQMRKFDGAIDQCISATARRFGDSQARTMRVLDRIATVALRAESLEDVLDALLTAFQQESPTVDTAAIYLVGDDRLWLRAAVGLEADVKGYSLRIGEGFAGRVAAERRPLALESAATDAAAVADVIRRANVRALHGVPLIDADRLIGVACMGSQTASSFSGQDRTLFASMASRAAAGIGHHLLRRKARSRADALEVSEKRFRDTFESAAIGLGHVSLDGAWLRMNDRYCALLGYPRDELMRLRFQDVTHRTDLADDASQMSSLIAGDVDNYTTEKRCIRKDGSIVWVDQTLSLVRQGDEPSYLIAAAQDVSQRVRQRQQRAFLADASTVLASTLDYRETLDNLAALIVPRIADWCVVTVADSAGVVLEPEKVAHVNLRDGELFEELLRRYPVRTDGPGPVADVLRTNRPVLLRVDDTLLREIGVDERHLADLQQLGLVSALILPLRIGGRTVGALSLAQSESGRRFDEQDVELFQELATIASAAIDNALLHAETQRAVHQRDRVLGIVTHDLRNPLGAIDLSATMLAMSRAVSADALAHAPIATIQRNVRRATRLIEDLLDMSSVQAGVLAMEREKQPLAEILQEAVEIHRPTADEKRIGFDVQLDIGAAAIFGDRDRLLQVLDNVIGNALKYCKADDAVAVRAAVEDDTALIAVADTGPGISAEQLEHIFQPYVRVQQDEEGTGLGLFIARAIVGAHGGRIWAESEVRAGTTMFISLPLASP